MQLFERQKHKVIWGDCIDVMRDAIDDNSIDLIFADPPYNIGKIFNGRRDTRGMTIILNGAIDG